MGDFLKTRKGLEYLLETSPSDMAVVDAIAKYEQDLKDSEHGEDRHNRTLANSITEDDRRKFPFENGG